MKLLSATAAAIILTMTIQQSHAQATPIGSTDFDVKDRLAVMHLINNYRSGDEGRWDVWQSIFWADAELVRAMAGKDVATPAEVAEWNRPRFEEFSERGIQRRHFLVSPVFETQSTSEATGHVYLQVLSVEDGKSSIEVVGIYNFVATKRGNEWRISRWALNLDTASPE